MINQEQLELLKKELNFLKIENAELKRKLHNCNIDFDILQLQFNRNNELKDIEDKYASNTPINFKQDEIRNKCLVEIEQLRNQLIP